MNAIDKTIEVLNRALAEDAEAIFELMEYRVSCNKELADDPTIQVLKDGDEYKVGLLGIINGILGIRENGWGHICAVYEVICPNDMDNVVKGGKVGDQCPNCDSLLKLGCLVEFKRLRI